MVEKDVLQEHDMEFENIKKNLERAYMHIRELSKLCCDMANRIVALESKVNTTNAVSVVTIGGGSYE